MRPGDGVADAGSQYSCVTFTDQLADQGIRPSIGSVADAYDNAPMECVIGLFKTECIRTTVFHPGPYRTTGDVEYATAGWVDEYNNRGLHSTLGMTSPVEFEQARYATLNPQPQPVWERRRTWGASYLLPSPSTQGGVWRLPQDRRHAR